MTKYICDVCFGDADTLLTQHNAESANVYTITRHRPWNYKVEDVVSLCLCGRCAESMYYLMRNKELISRAPQSLSLTDRIRILFKKNLKGGVNADER